MRRNLVFLVLVAMTFATVSIGHHETAQASPANKQFSGQTLFKATWAEFDVFNKVIIPVSETDGTPARVWLSSQRTKGDSDVYVQTNTWQPTGSTGWHTHPGHSLIYITSGTLTEYEADGANCVQHVYKAGDTFVDPGGDHAHIIRNESDAVATGYAIQIVPHLATRRVDVDPPANCSNIL